MKAQFSISELTLLPGAANTLLFNENLSTFLHNQKLKNSPSVFKDKMERLFMLVKYKIFMLEFYIE